ncbi:MAG: Mur ligase family protein, partial [Rhodothermales bacterium]|nr:Mur ligase family protein [Rhodothermales bacterium]
RPSFFEATTALAFRYFADEQVDCAVVEVGLGGRLDATNVLQPRLAVITNIGLVHTDLLGTTVPEIAREKAGIIKPGVPVVTAVGQPEALAVLREVAAAREAALHSIHEEAAVRVRSAGLGGLVLDAETPRRAYTGLHVGLPGAHQRSNAALAVRAAELAFPDLVPGAVAEGLRAVRALAGLRGRLDVLSRTPLVVADVAHNADGLAAALAFIDGHRDPAGRLHVLLGLMRDKDAEAVAAVLAGAAASVFVVALPTERAWAPEALAGSLRAAGVEVAGRGTVEEGRRRFYRQAAPHDALLAAGSHHVVAALLAAGSPGGGGA